MPEKVTRSEKAVLKIVGLGGVIHVFRSVFRQEREKAPEHFLTAQIGKNGDRENAGILRTIVKVVIFYLQNSKTRPFFNISA